MAINSIKSSKPKMTSTDLISKLKNEKGVEFNIKSEKEAIDYISKVNNYLRTVSYRKNYRKNHQGKYINLDFAYLVELSVIDMYIRNIATQMCIDVEHDLKVSLLSDMENNPAEDGYSIVIDFLKSPKTNYIENNITRNLFSPFVGNLINKYFVISKTTDSTTGATKNIITQNNCPAWVFVEILSFGDFLKFYEFYFQRKNVTQPIQSSVLNLVRSLRNGCAHNNCLICDLSSEKNTYTPTILSNYYGKIRKLSGLNKKLKCRFVLEFSALLYVYKTVVSENIRNKRVEELKTLFLHRIPKRKEYFQKNNKLMTSFFFLARIIENI